VSGVTSSCPQCGSGRVRLDGGCPLCLGCGWSKCDESRVRVDGGVFTLPREGGRVRDREATDDGEAIVVEVHPEVRAADYWIDDLQATVAEFNERYDPNAPVVTVAFVEAVEREVDGWRGAEDLRLAAEATDLTLYDYPAPRLEVLGQ